MQGWLDSIKSGTILALQKNASNGLILDPAKSISKEFGLSKETGHEELIHSILSVNQIELSLSSERREEIFNIPGNRKCADCRSASRKRLQCDYLTFFLDPDWASLSFGILICIKCSGIHRSLGVHLSKVRSLTLDFWNPEHVELLKCIGNERSWQIFEENLNVESDIDSLRAEADSSQQIKEKWILAKYVKRQFIKYPIIEDNEDKSDIIRTMMWDSIEKNDLVECLRSLSLGASVEDTCEISESDGEEKELVQTALQRAAQLKHWNIVALLLLWGADSENLDSLGRNLIHYLASIPDSSISVLLSVLRKNPSLGLWEDSDGRTPLQYAEISQNAPVATIIRIFQAQIIDEEPQTKGPGPRFVPTSGQDSPSTPKTPSATTLTSAFEKVLQLTHRGPFKRNK